MKSIRTCRLYMDHPLEAGALIPLSDDAFHYLMHVLRLGAKDILAVFNGHDGQWLGAIERVTKRHACVRVKTFLKPQDTLHPLKLYMPALRPSRMGFLLEKITEIGVTDVYPLHTQHSTHTWGKLEKAQRQMIEAAEQSERLCIPILHEGLSLEDLLRTLTEPLAWCYERSDPQTELPSQTSYSLLIGPEGGFSATEIDQLRVHPLVHEISLGSLILRAETAAIVGLYTLRHP